MNQYGYSFFQSAKFFLWIFLLTGTQWLFSQEFQNTLTFVDSADSPVADLQYVSWIAGHWRGEAFGGITEEIWSPPLGGSMMCAFKLVVNGEVSFYEICTITEEKNSLILRLKHFDGHLIGWEEKAETIEFKLVKVTPDKVYFDDFTFERISDHEMNIYVVIESQGKKEEVKFNYQQ
ncbi:MAG: hypothetical protein KDC57_02480 [Saprospiraceae bacterium]|nr:hypothetical protein [Saprospiraceae bacterium]